MDRLGKTPEGFDKNLEDFKNIFKRIWKILNKKKMAGKDLPKVWKDLEGFANK